MGVCRSCESATVIFKRNDLKADISTGPNRTLEINTFSGSVHGLLVSLRNVRAGEINNRMIQSFDGYRY